MAVRRLFLRTLIALLALATGPSPGFANDSIAEMSIGGLQLVRTDSIAIESEKLSISLNAVDVQYRFNNLSGKPLTVTVAFPLPDIDLAELDSVFLPSSDPKNFVDFRTSVDGQPIALTIDQRAMLGTADVSDHLRQLRIPFLPVGPNELRPGDLSEETRKDLIEASLLVPAGSDERGRRRYAPGWSVKTSAVREQTFPADRPILVEHHYRPSVGGSSDTILRRSLRQNKALASEVARYLKDYCISDAFLAELDKQAGNSVNNAHGLSERRINYVLKSGSNWAGPIKSFELKIDKGAPNRLVSFCAGPLKSTSSTDLVFRALDFKPDADLKILVIGRF